MLKENNPLLILKLKKEKTKISNIINNIFEALYSLYDLILEDPIENIWLEYLNIILGYGQLSLFIFEEIVRIQLFIFVNDIVFDNMESEKFNRKTL